MKIVSINHNDSTKITREQIVELFGDDLCFMDGFDSCIVGIVKRCGFQNLICYDTQLVLDELMSSGDMSLDEAEEFFSFNQLGAWMGENTPCFITMI